MTMRRVGSMQFIFNEKYEFKPYVVSYYARPTKKLFKFLYTYIESHADELLKMVEYDPDIFVAVHNILFEVMKHRD